MKRKVIVWVCIGLVLCAIPVGGWLWLSRMMDDMMFVPGQRDTERLREHLEPLFGKPIMSATVVRVDRDANLIFFTFSASQSEIESTIAALEDQGWSVSSSTSSSMLTISASHDPGDYKFRQLQLETLGHDTYYGGYQFAGIHPNLATRYEENKVYAEQ